MKHDIKIQIAVGASRESKKWKNTTMFWSELANRLSNPVQTPETYRAYMAMSRDDQTSVKDVGGFVGGYLVDGKRLKRHVGHRQILTLDIDTAHLDFWETFTLLYSNAAVIHSTHKHHASSPRYRLIMPLDRECSADEYAATARWVAGVLGIDAFDPTTFDVERLMFWPSVSKDVEYYYRLQDGEPLCVDETLANYVDWTDSSLWPTSQAQTNQMRTAADKQEDPENKRGIVGAFCRTYTISTAIETFLADIYTHAGEDRYTFVGGTTSGGLVTYDDKFAYSHHGTDPASGKLSNAFDLVRLHKFGHLDEDAPDGANGKKLKSFGEMETFARKDEAVKRLIGTEKMDAVKYDFAEAAEDFATEKVQDDFDWLATLEVDAKSNYLSTAKNLNAIFDNDARLKGAFRLNKFTNRHNVVKNLPWRAVNSVEDLKNVDYSGVRNYIETIYGITGSLKIDDCLNLVCERNSFHPVLDYLRPLVWDGVPRIDLLLVQYFGADNNIYTREAIRVMLIGAISRIMKPGTKFDYALMLTGAQGAGKSTFIKKLGVKWSSDSFLGVQGKEAYEQIQGAWLIEMAELAGLRKTEIEAVKHYMTKTSDTFRPAYGRTSETYDRQCVFFGTTNSKEFLKDTTGNRRFLPIQVNPDRITKSVFNDLTESEVSQIWAEAMAIYRKGSFNLTLSAEADQIAKAEQLKHSEIDERAGIIEMYLNMLLPANWSHMGLFERREYVRSYLRGEDNLDAIGVNKRTEVCTAEIWAECLGEDTKDMSKLKTKDLNEIMRTFAEWEYVSATKRFTQYGPQRYFKLKQ